MKENISKIKFNKQIIFFIHKEIQLENFEREASYNPNSDWNYHVIENLESVSKNQNNNNNVTFIGKLSTEILEEISFTKNFTLFVELFKKSFEKLILKKDQFEYIEKYLIQHINQFQKTNRKSARKCSNLDLINISEPIEMGLYMSLHEMVIKELDYDINKQWESHLFKKKELYITTFDIEQLILNIFSDEYIKLLNKFLKIMIKYSCIYFTKFYSTIPNKRLKKMLFNSFSKTLQNQKQKKILFIEQSKILDFKLPFIQYKIDCFIEDFKFIELEKLLKDLSDYYRIVSDLFKKI